MLFMILCDGLTSLYVTCRTGRRLVISKFNVSHASSLCLQLHQLNATTISPSLAVTVALLQFVTDS
jgi:hypothetical protein